MDFVPPVAVGVDFTLIFFGNNSGIPKVLEWIYSVFHELSTASQLQILLALFSFLIHHEEHALMNSL